MDLFTLGTKLYDCRRKINYRCVLVFMVRSMMHHGESKALQEFLQQTEMRKRFFCGTSAGVCPAYTAVFLSELQGC